MVRLPAIIAALLAAGMGYAQGGGAVEGQVLDSITGAPIRKVSVGINCGGDQAFSESDTAGRFSFQKVRAGTCNVSVGANGYSFGQSEVIVVEGRTSGGIAFRLAPTSAISGRIVDEDGDPLPGFQVQLFYETYGSGRKALFPENDGKATTDDRGRYRIAGLVGGKYYLSVSPPGNNEYRVANQTSRYVTTFYPGITDPASAAPVVVPEGSELENLNLKLRRVPVVSVSGRFTGAATASVYLERVTIVAFQQGIQTRNTGNGNFEFRGVPPGEYTLIVRFSDQSEVAGGGGRPKLIATATRAITVGSSDLEGLTIAIAPPIVLTARVTVDEEPSRDLSKVVLTIEPVLPRTADDHLSRSTQANGIFRFDELSADRYRMRAYPNQDGLYLKSVKIAGRELPEPVFDLGGSAEIEVVLSGKVASVSGVVHLPGGDQPAKGVAVVLIPQSKALQYQITTTDESGLFAIRNIQPGEYRAFAWEKLGRRAFEYYDPEFVRPVESKGVAVSLGDSASKSIELTMIPAEAK